MPLDMAYPFYGGLLLIWRDQIHLIEDNYHLLTCDFSNNKTFGCLCLHALHNIDNQKHQIDNLST
ncbi:hypothetical protein DPMN_149103 [Dreissena polymorpha]|uniref:Uncharacterized protein n=1 Tax=Dreissena polymorpha TaxID=45954 RepID=A0A9D4FAT0_DREPO|nr:hypothetical protein DPMN_149103 [Dreissena polymorpha]